MYNETKVQTNLLVDCVSSDGIGASYFDKRSIELNGDHQRQLSEQIEAVNFRLRTSPASYEADWHVAHDPTLLIILSGTMLIELRDGKTKQFSAGEMFVAQDYMRVGNNFNETIHGHRARVIGSDELKALHLKLSKR